MKPSNIQITFSQHDLTNKNSEAFQKTVKNITIHPGYHCQKIKDDIAILELESILQWSESVLPACFPFAVTHEKYTTFNDLIGIVAGWGWTHEEAGKGNYAKRIFKELLLI